MKLKSLLLNSVLAIGAAAVLRAQEIKFPGKVDTPPAAAANPAAPSTPSAIAAPTFSEPQMLEMIGWFMGRNSQAESFDLTAEQIDVVMKGFKAAISGNPPPYEFKAISPQLQAFVAAKQEAYFNKLKAKGMAESAQFLAEIKKKPGVQTTSSGLAYEIIKQGEGAPPKPTDTIRFNYTGQFVNGTVFDSSVQRNEPAEYPLDQVIPGWTEGLQKISKGGKIKLYVPPQLAYGDEGKPGVIPPASTLIFEIELLDYKPTLPAAVPSAAPAK